MMIQAVHYTLPSAPRRIDLIVLHTMETPETAQKARGCARWFAGQLAPRFPAPKASAHYCADADEIVQCVPDAWIAWHAPGANANGIGIEMAGFAKQTAAEWADDYSRKMLAQVAELCARLCVTHRIPARIVETPELVIAAHQRKLGSIIGGHVREWGHVPHEGRSDVFGRGITTHAACSRAWPKLAGPHPHTDPGAHFPLEAFVAEVERIARDIEAAELEAIQRANAERET